MAKKCILAILVVLMIWVQSVCVFGFSLEIPDPEYLDPIELFNDSNRIDISGMEHSMSAATYYSKESDSLMVPVRYVCLGLGLSEGAIKWDGANSVLTIDAGSRIIQMQAGNGYYSVNRTMIPVLNDKGEAASVEIRDGRAYVPYQMIAEALQVTVKWTEDGTGVIYNAPEYYR